MIAAWQTRGTFEDGLNLFIHLYLWGFFCFLYVFVLAAGMIRIIFFFLLGLSFRPFPEFRLFPTLFF